MRKSHLIDRYERDTELIRRLWDVFVCAWLRDVDEPEGCPCRRCRLVRDVRARLGEEER